MVQTGVDFWDRLLRQIFTSPAAGGCAGVNLLLLVSESGVLSQLQILPIIRTAEIGAGRGDDQ